MLWSLTQKGKSWAECPELQCPGRLSREAAALGGVRIVLSLLTRSCSQASVLRGFGFKLSSWVLKEAFDRGLSTSVCGSPEVTG